MKCQVPLLLLAFPCECVRAKSIQLCPTLCDPVDCSPPGSSVHGILQARIVDWVPVPFSRGSLQPGDQTWLFCIAGRFFTTGATFRRNTPGKARRKGLDCTK